MKFGAPIQGAFATGDPLALRDYVQTVEELGYDFVVIDELILFDDPAAIFHESLTLYAYLAAVTTTIELVTAVIILPLRSTIMLARQAAEVDVLSGGRLRLGVAVGGSESRHEVFGVDAATRGELIAEQVEVLRQLWTQPNVSFKGAYHDFQNININLRPSQSIPIWMGGEADAVLRRTARLADGWLAYMPTHDKFKSSLAKLSSYLVEINRPRDDFTIANFLITEDVPEDQWGSVVTEWDNLGVTHIVCQPKAWRTDPVSMEDYLAVLRRFMAVV